MSKQNPKRKRKRKSASRYNKMKRVIHRSEKRGVEIPRLGFSDHMREWWRRTKIILKSKIFRRTAVIGTSFLLMAGGYAEVQRSRAAQAYEQAMTVSPANQPMSFALSGVRIEYRPQFRSGQTYIVPFVIDNLEGLSLNPKDYIVQLQGTNEDIDPTLSARLVLFGTSGRGAIVVEGEYTGEPLNMYIISTNSLAGFSGDRVTVTSEEISQMQAEQGNLIINQNADGTSVEERDDSVRTGIINIAGQEMVVGVDMTATRVNPSAENVTPTYREVNIDSTPAELYDVTFGAVDRSAILTNQANTVEARDGVVDTIKEYNYRLKDDPTISPQDERLIVEANDIAINSLGESHDNKRIEELLAQTSQYSTKEVSEATKDNKPLSEMTEEERRSFLESQIDTDSLGISQQTSTLKALDRLRITVADLNYQLALYEVELAFIDDVSAAQDDMGRSAVRYEILTPFR